MAKWRTAPSTTDWRTSAYIVALRRLEKARACLVEGLSGAEVAAACGFADQSHFIRCFKEVMGISPLAYRKMLLS